MKLKSKHGPRTTTNRERRLRKWQRERDTMTIKQRFRYLMYNVVEDKNWVEFKRKIRERFK